MGSIRRALFIGSTGAFLLLCAILPRSADAANLQSITVAPETVTLRKSFSQTLVATGHYDDGSTANVSQQANWTVGSVGVAVVENSFGLKGLVTANNKGTTRVTAAVVVGTTTIRGSATVTVTDGDLVSITTKPTTKNLEVGQASQFKATATFLDDSTDDVTNDVTWSSTDPTIASVSNTTGSKGLVTAHKVGTVTIIALDPDSGLTNTDGAANVRAQVSHLSFDPPSVIIGKGMKFPIRVYANRVDGTRSQITEDVEYSVVPTGVIKVGTGDDAGILTALANGAVTLSAFDPKRNLSTSTSGDDARIAVKGKLVGLRVESNPIRLTVGDVKNARAIGVLNNGKDTSDLRRLVQWSVSDATVASVGNTVNDVGEVTAKKSGTTTLRASYGGFVSAETDNVQVLGPLKSVALEAGDGLIPLDEEVELKARGTYDGNIELNIGDKCTWSVVNPTIAEVDDADSSVDGDGKGTIIGKKLGQTTVNVNCSGKKNSAPIQVIGHLIGLEMDPMAYAAEALEEKQFRAWGQYDDNSQKDLTKTSTWSSSKPDVATVDNTIDPGTVTGIGTGSSTITAKRGPFTATGVVSVGSGLVSMKISPASKTIRGSDRSQFNAIGVRANGDTVPLTKRVVWSSSDSQVVRVSNREGEQGLIFGGAKEGTANIIASLPNTDFVATSAVTTACLMSSFEITMAPRPIPVGRARIVKARATFCNGGAKKVITPSVFFFTSNPAVVLVSNEPKSNGLLTAVAPGTATISAVDISSGKSAGNTLQVKVQ